MITVSILLDSVEKIQRFVALSANIPVILILNRGTAVLMQSLWWGYSV